MKTLGKRILAVLLVAALCLVTGVYDSLPGGVSTVKAAETVLTDKEAEELYTQYFEKGTYKRVSVHDPSIVVGYYEGEYSSSSTVYGVQNQEKTRKEIYFIFGSHKAWAYSLDLKNWVTFENNINSDYAKIFEKDAEWSALGSSSYDVSGNLWAPDVIWNPDMNKWCMYMSVNGDRWYTSVVLLTADSLNGDWTRVGPVVYSGFTTKEEAEKTDLFQVIGDSEGRDSVPERYLRNRNGNHTYGMNAIDPCVLYDDGGTLWMTYGSWFGGIYMLKLDENTGLRDYTQTYETTENESDAYQGIMLAGGNHCSGEASYIQKINDKYYLFMSYGGLEARNGYNMRIFFSNNITGPYKDLAGNDARKGITAGAGTVDGSVGNRLMSYYKWSFMNRGFTAQGHNSAIVDDDGRAYVVYHTRFDQGTEEHQVRVHQLFQAKNGGLVTAPFEYSGEKLAESAYAKNEVTGEYKIITMKTSEADHKSLKCATEQTIQLKEDGTVTGAYTGTWEQSADGPYVTLQSNNVTYQGVFLKQNIEETTYETMCLTLVGNNDVSIWGYQTFAGSAAVVKAVKNLKVKIGQMTYAKLDLPTDIMEGVDVTWSSSDPDVIATDGTVTAPSQNKEVTLTVTMKSGDYSYSKKFTTTVLANMDGADTETGLKALYNFNEDLTNEVNSSQKGEALAEEKGTKPTRKYNAERGSGILHQQFGYPDDKSTSYVKYPNPLKGESLSGATVSLWVNRLDTDVWDAIWSFYDTDNADGIDGRLYLTPNMYLGYNGTGGWFDINHPDDNKASATNAVAAKEWALVTVSITGNSVSMYVNGILMYTYDQNKHYQGDLTDRTYPLKLLSSSADFYTGYGSWWGSSPLYMDNIRIYNRALSDKDVLKLYVEEMEEVENNLNGDTEDVSGYYYYNDYNKTANATDVWVSESASGSLSIDADEEGRYKSYVKFAPGAVGGSRSAYSAFTDMLALPDKYTVEFDANLKIGNDAKNSSNQLALATGVYNKTNSPLTNGYIWALSNVNKSASWTTSSNKQIVLSEDTWLHFRTEISQPDKTATLKITGKDVSIEETITGLTATQVQGILWLGGRQNSVGCFDNVRIFAYDVAFDANGGTGTMTNQGFRLDNAAKLKQNKFKRTGYTFEGWATSASGNVSYEDEESVTNLAKSGTVVLYAKWKALPPTNPGGSKPGANKPGVNNPGGGSGNGGSGSTGGTGNTADPVKEGAVYKAGSLKYKVTSVKKKTVTITGPNKKTVKSVTIGKTVKIKGTAYKITQIGNNAFSKCKKLKKVTIGANVTKIGKKAFYKDAKLKSIVVKTKKLKSVGSQALKGIHKKAKIKVPSSKLKKYKKLFKKKGQARTVKIKK